MRKDKCQAILAKLARAIKAYEQLPELIAQAREKGATWQQITDATKLSRKHCDQLARKARGGELPHGNPRFNVPTATLDKPRRKKTTHKPSQ